MTNLIATPDEVRAFALGRFPRPFEDEITDRKINKLIKEQTPNCEDKYEVLSVVATKLTLGQ